MIRYKAVVLRYTYYPNNAKLAEGNHGSLRDKQTHHDLVSEN
jgi:hypothetical protein